MSFHLPLQYASLNSEQEYRLALLRMVQARAELMDGLRCAASLGVQTWAIGAGVIRSLVWDELHGFVVPTRMSDWDFVYYDPTVPMEHEAALRARLAQCDRHVDRKWDVVNQAHVHHWLARENGSIFEAYADLTQAIASWPETATCVAVYLNQNQELEIIAPFGLRDLFELKVRRNSHCLSPQAFAQRRVEKNWQDIWPQLQYVVDGASTT
ncbi:MAG: nucleotidyltransferase family protein [Burkholderiaceae bacterium]|nr:MAG: nucleotidyltransferase family protein [Burkholderiaceae bacterium]